MGGEAWRQAVGDGGPYLWREENVTPVATDVEGRDDVAGGVELFEDEDDEFGREMSKKVLGISGNLNWRLAAGWEK